MVERDLAKVEVAGSTPVSRSSGVSLPTFPCQQPRFTFHLAHQARYPSGKGEVCKTFMRRFDPDPRLQIFQPKARRILELAVVVSLSLFRPWLSIKRPTSYKLGSRAARWK